MPHWKNPNYGIPNAMIDNPIQSEYVLRSSLNVVKISFWNCNSEKLQWCAVVFLVRPAGMPKNWTNLESGAWSYHAFSLASPFIFCERRRVRNMTLMWIHFTEFTNRQNNFCSFNRETSLGMPLVLAVVHFVFNAKLELKSTNGKAFYRWWRQTC